MAQLIIKNERTTFYGAVICGSKSRMRCSVLTSSVSEAGVYCAELLDLGFSVNRGAEGAAKIRTYIHKLLFPPLFINIL